MILYNMANAFIFLVFLGILLYMALPPFLNLVIELFVLLVEKGIIKYKEK